MGLRRGDERSTRSIGMLISMLVRYPEVGAVKYDPRQQTMRLSLLVTGTLDDGEFERLRQVLIDTLSVYNQLEDRQPAVLTVAREEFGSMTGIQLTRDVTTMTPAEVWTVVEFFRDWFPGRLVAEPVEVTTEDEWTAQDEMIEEILAELDGGRSGRDLIAIREEGRVMVFQK